MLDLLREVVADGPEDQVQVVVQQRRRLQASLLLLDLLPRGLKEFDVRAELIVRHPLADRPDDVAGPGFAELQHELLEAGGLLSVLNSARENRVMPVRSGTQAAARPRGVRRRT